MGQTTGYTPKPSLATIAEAAAFLKVSLRTIQNYQSRGLLSTVYFGKLRRFRWAEIIELENTGAPILKEETSPYRCGYYVQRGQRYDVECGKQAVAWEWVPNPNSLEVTADDIGFVCARHREILPNHGPWQLMADLREIAGLFECRWEDGTWHEIPEPTPEEVKSLGLEEVK